MNRLLGRSVYGQFKTACGIVLASLEAEKKQFYYFWQHFLNQILCVSVYGQWVQTADWSPYTETHCNASVYGHFVLLSI